MAGAFPGPTGLKLRLFDRFWIVGDPPDSEESVSSTLDRVLLKVGIAMWVFGCKVRPPSRPPYVSIRNAAALRLLPHQRRHRDPETLLIVGLSHNHHEALMATMAAVTH